MTAEDATAFQDAVRREYGRDPSFTLRLPDGGAVFSIGMADASAELIENLLSPRWSRGSVVWVLGQFSDHPRMAGAHPTSLPPSPSEQ